MPSSYRFSLIFFGLGIILLLSVRAVYFVVLIALDFIVHVLCGPHMIANDDGAVNLVIALV